MKKFLPILFVYCALSLNAQVVFNQSFDHKPLYGDRGECLFPMDKDNFAELTGIVECNLSATQIGDAVSAWLGREIIMYKLEIDNDEKFISNRQVIFRAEMPVGSKLIGTPAAATGVELQWETSESDLSFICKIDIKDNKFRYRFFQIVTDRWRLRGDAESEGAINDIHWQRINCLESMQAKALTNRKFNEYEEAIEKEKEIYELEYEQMKRLENDLINCVNENSDIGDDWDF